jgi:hypothetical protein
MRVIAVFVRVNNKPEYAHGEQRLLDSYLKFKPQYPHKLVIIDRNGDSPDDIEAKHLRYDKGGWDCGAWQFAGKNIDTDLLVCFNSSTYITGDNWLKHFVDAVEKHGDGLYGPLTSYEIAPHVRTPCMIFQPHVINDYPMEVQSREDTYRFESLGWPNGVPNFTQWVKNKGQKTVLVTWDGSYDLWQWRTPPNIFRRGDQSNLIVKDRHCEAYEVSYAENKARLEALADGR